MEYREFRIHDIIIEHPHDWRISMKNFAVHEQGDVDIHGTGNNEIAVSLSWKPLSEYTGRFSTVEAYSEHVTKSFEKDKRFADFQVISQNSLHWRGHSAVQLHLRFQITIGTFRRKTQLIDRVNFFTFCSETNRAVIAYLTLSSEAYEEEKALVREIMNSIRCHSDET